jgi:hypothetical protein
MKQDLKIIDIFQKKKNKKSKIKITKRYFSYEEIKPKGKVLPFSRRSRLL